MKPYRCPYCGAQFERSMRGIRKRSKHIHRCPERTVCGAEGCDRLSTYHGPDGALCASCAAALASRNRGRCRRGGSE